MLKRISTLAVVVLGLMAPATARAACDVDYQVQPEDTLFSIAEKHYGDRGRWTLIYYGNQSRLSGPVAQPGDMLFIPCAPGQATPDATPLRQDDAEMKLLTGGGFAPFTDPSLPGQGLATELVNAAVELMPSPVSYSLTWEDDWSQHLFPMLNDKQFDMGFPWYKPDCEADPQDERCVNFHFSDPLIEIPMMLFTRADASFSYDSDADILGKTLCRPKGYATHDLDRADRRWLSEDKITLVQPDTPAACFHMVNEGKVDAATVNLFLGASTIIEEGLRSAILPIERPLSEQSLHVVISKRHWRGTSHLYRINAGLAELKKQGRFEEIVARHLESFWSQLQ